MNLTPSDTTADLPKPTSETPATEPSEETEPEDEAVEATPTEPETQAEESPSEEESIDILVTATRTPEQLEDVPRSVTVIPRQAIEQQTQLTRNLQDILGNLVPGLAPPTQSSSNFGQSLRGRNTLVLIDGVPQSTSRNAFRDLRTIDPAAIERIEVVRGPSAIYGDGATGGVINIITRQPSEERLRACHETSFTSFPVEKTIIDAWMMTQNWQRNSVQSCPI